MPISQLQSPTTVWNKILWFCYYYGQFFGMVAFGIKRDKPDNSRNKNNLKVTIIRNNEIENIKESEVRKFYRIELTLRAHVSETLVWLLILIRLILCVAFTYLVFKFWPSGDYIFSFLICTQLIMIVICPSIMSIVEICHKERIVHALNVLFRLINDVEELQCPREIFRGTHVIFAALKVVTFLFEMIIACQSLLGAPSVIILIERIMQRTLLAGIWLNIHAITFLYVTIHALYGGLNHCMRHQFIPRLRAVQAFGHVTTEAKIDQLTKDMARFMELFKTVQRVGLELHSLWQLPVASTLVSSYLGVLGILYYMIWHYYQNGDIHMRFIPSPIKALADTLLLSLAAHRAIKSSQLIGCMGLENAILVENDNWHKQIDQFLYHINLYELKLNFLGLGDLSNALTLTYIGGILTSISIFIPFSIKTYRMQKILEQQN